MMINPISGSANLYSIKPDKTQSRALNNAQKEEEKIAKKVSSGKKVNSAADSASALAILAKMTAQWRGYEVGSSNIQDMRSAMNVADGALSSMGDSAARMQELTLKAANGTMAQSDRQAIQDEINQLQEFMSQTTEYTQFNTQNLIDGSFQNKNVASDPSGKGISISIGNASPNALGLSGIDVTGDYDSIASALDSIKSASSQISSMRGDIGATSNRLDSQYAVNQQTSINLQESASRIGDADIAKLAMEYQQNMIRQQIGSYLIQQNPSVASQLSLLA